MYIYLFTEYRSERLFTLVVWVFCFLVFFIIRLKEDTEEYHKLIVKFQIGEIDIILFCLRFFFYEQNVIIGFALRTLL